MPQHPEGLRSVQGLPKVLSYLTILIQNVLCSLLIMSSNNCMVFLHFVTRFWHVIPCGGNTFEVRKGYDAFNVDEPKRTCSCRMWQQSGLPCTHAIACIFKLGKYVEDYVPDYFRKDKYMLAYSEYIKPVDGIHF